MRPWPQQSSKCRAVKDSPSPVAAASSAKVRSGTRRNRTAHLLNAIQELVPVAPFRCQLRRLGDRTSKARGRHHGHEDALSLAPHALPRGNSGSRNNSKFSRPCDCAQSTTAGRPNRLRKTTGTSCFRSRSGPMMRGRCEHGRKPATLMRSMAMGSPPCGICPASSLSPSHRASLYTSMSV
jgi:hypothetical protein